MSRSGENCAQREGYLACWRHFFASLSLMSQTHVWIVPEDEVDFVRCVVKRARLIDHQKLIVSDHPFYDRFVGKRARSQLIHISV
jgi:hypothetical protein